MKSFRPGPLTLILAAAYLLRLLYFLLIFFKNPNGFWVYDSFGYWKIAENLLEHGTFSQSQALPLVADVYRTPLYPLFISVFQATGLGYYILVFVQLIVSTATCYFAYRTAREVFENERAALAAGAIAAIDIPSIVFANLILTETIFTFLFAISVFHFVVYLKKNSTRHLVFAALCTGLSVLCRPVGLAALGVFALVALYKGKLNMTTLKKVLLLVSVCLLVVFPWALRNRIQFGQFFVSLIGSDILLSFHAANIVAETEHISYDRAQRDFRLRVVQEFDGDAVNEPARFAAFAEFKAMEVIQAHPGLFVKNNLIGMSEMLFKPVKGYIDIQCGSPRNGSAGTLIRKLAGSGVLTKVLLIFQVLMMGIVWLGCIAGIRAGWRKYKILLLTLSILILVFSMFTIPPLTDPRFRVPLVPLLAMLSSYGLQRMVTWFNERRVRST